jgi:ABC-type nitrate/sulfonate/bicarbonate transport system permease component
VTATAGTLERTRVVRRTPGRAETDWKRWASRQRALRLSLAVAVPVVLLGLWELGARQAWFDDRFFSSPSLIWDRALELVESGELQRELLVTTRRLLIGYVVGSGLGIVVGLLLSMSRLLQAALEPTLRALYVIPKLALLPVLLLLFGVTETPKVMFVVIGVFFIVAFSTLSAAVMIPVGYREVASSYGLSWQQRVRWMTIPASLPHIVAGLRLASGIAVLLVIAAEFVQSTDGIGYMAWHAWELFLADEMYVGIVVMSLLGVTFSGVVGFVGKKLTPWASDSFGT